MMKKFLLLMGILFTFQAMAQPDAETQKEIKRYHALKPQVEKLLKTSNSLYYDMPDAAYDYHQGKPEAWREMFNRLKKLDTETHKALGNDPLEPVYGRCVAMENILTSYWQDVISGDAKISQAQYKENRLDCLESYVFGLDRINENKNLAVVPVWDMPD
ncbi:hypothetical protein PUS30_000260 [Salmonella enterica]|nr:hypothetical protein [Salmonella enterica]EDL1779507.1 hypothetical protein [Salmonella enterica subsp. enterica serovar Poona]EDV2766418.1 hypothetical protein [Salmonella enterica subsp. enterica serovar Soahanina]EED3952092.1 hypothetical protein [Salmonella enterica subsp. enterica serovar Newport]EEJ1917313.1 hypothetical protein [Salmonella enterica subsp. enterica serovar Urbana]EIR0330092.1 hypothetical protein [Salmonella enterica subsp. enterica serovar Give]